MARLVFRGARGSRSSGCCTTTRGWKLEDVLPGRGSRRPSVLGPPAPTPRPQGAATARGRAGPGAQEAAPRPAAPGLARCWKEARAASGSFLGGGGEEGYPPPSPELAHRVPQSQQPLGNGGRGSTAPPGAGLGEEDHGLLASLPASARLWGGRGPPLRGGGGERRAAPTPPSPRTVVNRSAARPESEGGSGRRRTGRPGGI